MSHQSPDIDLKKVDSIDNKSSTNNNHNDQRVIKKENIYKIENPLELGWKKLTILAEVKQSVLEGTKLVKKMVQKPILDNIAGVIRPGRFTAIMGPSGSGKTTLLNLISGRLTSTNLSLYGEITLNGKVVNDLEPYGNQMAYVMQDDILLPILTPRQAFMFTANMRLKNLSQEQKIKRVNDLIVELGLTRCADTKIGDALMKGISGGERKRTSIGVELLTNPSLLFLDEPTTGLDSSTALSVIEVMKNLAAKGVNIVSTIHQPSSEIYAEFDQLILIVQGHIIYQGEATEAVKYFSKLGFECPKTSNPGDYFTKLMNPEGLMIEKMQKGESLGTDEEIKAEFQVRLQKFVEAYQNSENFQNNEATFQRDLIENALDYNVSAMRQFSLVWKRSIIKLLRNPMELQVKIMSNIFMAVVMIIVFNDLGTGFAQTQSTNGALFFIITMAAMNGIQGSMAIFSAERPLFLRERLNQTYTTGPYFWGKTFAEFPFDLMYPLILSSMVYFSIGLNTNNENQFWIFLGSLELVYFHGASWGLFIACLIPKVEIAMALIPVLVVPLMVMGGLFVNLNNIPYFLYPIEYLSMFKYGFQALTENEFTDPSSFDCGNIQLANGQLIQNYQCNPLRDHDFSENMIESLIIMAALGVFFRFIAILLMKQISSPPKPKINAPQDSYNVLVGNQIQAKKVN